MTYWAQNSARLNKLEQWELILWLCWQKNSREWMQVMNSSLVQKWLWPRDYIKISFCAPHKQRFNKTFFTREFSGSPQRSISTSISITFDAAIRKEINGCEIGLNSFKFSHKWRAPGNRGGRFHGWSPGFGIIESALTLAQNVYFELTHRWLH